MKTTIQITTISGAIIDKAIWEVQFSVPPVIGHDLLINLNVLDEKLMQFLSAQERRGLILDGNQEEGFTITIKCDIKNIKHIMEINSSSCKTIVIASPENRTSEQVLLYSLDPKSSSLNFRNHF